MKTIETWLENIQKMGYRLTSPRRAVVETFAHSQKALDPFEVFELTRRQYPKLGLVTVYRTIDKLEELQLIQRVHRPSGCQAFIAAFTGHQHLLICNQCGNVEFFEGDQDQIRLLISEVARKSRYDIESHWLQFFGTCRKCLNDQLPS